MGQVIGAILADTHEHAREAAKEIGQKLKYEELDAIITIKVLLYENSHLMGVCLLCFCFTIC